MNKFQKIIENMSALVQKVVLGDNEKMKKLASNGVVLPPPAKNELLTIIFFLQYDSDADIVQSAKNKFVTLPETIIIEALKSELHQYVIAGCYRYLIKQENQNLELFKAIIKHHNFKFNLIEKQLPQLSTDIKSYLAEALSIIAPYPSVMKFLIESEIPKAQKQKILDFAERNNLELGLTSADGLKNLSGKEVVKEEKTVEAIKEEPPKEEAMKSNLPDLGASGQKEDGEQDAELKEADENLSNEELGISEETSGKYESEAEQVLDERKSLARLINEMSIADKIKLAMKGNMEARGLLIKQTNRLIVEGVIRNPMITEQEVVKFSADKNIHRDVIKYIANNRAWLRKYVIKMNVILNPKTPAGRAVKLLTTLRTNDIKKISKMKGISSAIKRAALEHISRLEKKKNKKK